MSTTTMLRLTAPLPSEFKELECAAFEDLSQTGRSSTIETLKA